MLLFLYILGDKVVSEQSHADVWMKSMAGKRVISAKALDTEEITTT